MSGARVQASAPTIMVEGKPRLALLGDSIFDSRRYLVGRPNVATRVMHNGCRCQAILLAVSGSRLADLGGQIARVPAGTTDLVVSIGGNDLLDLARTLAANTGGTLDKLARSRELLDDFRQRYARACDRLRPLAPRIAVCSIYAPQTNVPMLRGFGTTALELANRAIEHEAKRRGIARIDLRETCRAPSDFHDPIHPSDSGAEKIAGQIARWVADR